MEQSASASMIKRNTYYIDPEFQSRFIVKFCCLVVLGAALTIGVLYCLAQYATTIAIVKARVQVTTATDFILPFLLQTVTIVAVIVSLASIGVTLFVSHRIAGPMFRFKETLKELCGGNFTHQVRLRKGDQLQPFATEFNEMITAVSNKIHAAEMDMTAIQKGVAAIGDQGMDEAKRKQLGELKLKVVSLQKTLKFFRT